MLAAVASNPKPVSTDLFLRLRRQLSVFIDKRDYGQITYDVSATAIAEVEQVETLRQDQKAGESLDSFLIRVWARRADDGAANIAFSVHDGQLTAKITRRATDRLAELEAAYEAQLDLLGLQVGRLVLYADRLERYGDDQVRHYPLEA